MMAEHTPYQEQDFRDIQAGGFKKRSLLDRLNPFTPFSSKKFVPTEKGQEFLDKFKKDTGKNLVVLPMEQRAIDEMKEAYGFTASGYFTPRDIIGGSRDPFNRYVYLDPKDPSLYTLAHEGGHAQDKNLLYDPYQRERRILSRRGKHTRKSPSSYEEFIKGDGKGAMDLFKDELVAEQYARDYFQDKNLQKPSEAMALNYEIAKGKSFPYDDYQKFNVEAFPTDYPMTFLQNYLRKKDDFYGVKTGDENLTSSAIRGKQKFYDDYLGSDFRKNAFENYLNSAYQTIKSQGMDDERAKKVMNMNLGF